MNGAARKSGTAMHNSGCGRRQRSATQRRREGNCIRFAGIKRGTCVSVAGAAVVQLDAFTPKLFTSQTRLPHIHTRWCWRARCDGARTCAENGTHTDGQPDKVSRRHDGIAPFTGIFVLRARAESRAASRTVQRTAAIRRSCCFRLAMRSCSMATASGDAERGLGLRRRARRRR